MSAKKARVRVELGERSYPIQIASGSLDEAGPAIARATNAEKVAIVTVPGVGRRYGARLARSLKRAGIRAQRVDVPDGDGSKSLKQLSRLYDAFLAAGLDRHSAVVALGGGMVGDLAGYAAASFLRGIPVVQVPTTLLAMVDSSVGGKVAVNLPQGKNLVGAFHQPRLVWIDLETLQSLPRRERAAGMTEAIKKAAIWDARFFARLEKNVERALALEPDALLPTVRRACEIKAEVVSMDEREAGTRALLNFGHTMGHAIEKIERYRGILHGEAVAIGAVYAARVSEALDLSAPGTEERLKALLERAGLPTQLPRHPRKAYLEALRVDKKRKSAHIAYVVLCGIGQADTVDLTPAEILAAGA